MRIPFYYICWPPPHHTQKRVFVFRCISFATFRSGRRAFTRKMQRVKRIFLLFHASFQCNSGFLLLFLCLYFSFVVDVIVRVVVVSSTHFLLVSLLLAIWSHATHHIRQKIASSQCQKNNIYRRWPLSTKILHAAYVCMAWHCVDSRLVYRNAFFCRVHVLLHGLMDCCCCCVSPWNKEIHAQKNNTHAHNT